MAARLGEDFGSGMLEMGPEIAEQMELIAELSKGLPEEQQVREAVKAAEPVSVRRQSLIQKISNMTVVERIQLAIKGPREARTSLIRDSNKIIQRAVLQSPRLTETDVESFASMTNLSADILRIIAANRGFMKNYVIVRNLTNNPKMPLDISLRLLLRLRRPSVGPVPHQRQLLPLAPARAEDIEPLEAPPFLWRRGFLHFRHWAFGIG